MTTFRYDIHCYGHQFSLLQGALGDPFRWVSRPRGPPASAKPQAIFTGNPEKNREIVNRTAMYWGPGATPSTVARDLASNRVNFMHCRNLLAGKEWGDKLQVLSVFVYKMLEPGKRYVLLTNDKVVFTLAMSLGVRTIWSGVENHTKIIKHFNPPTNPLDLLNGIKKSFTQRKKEIFNNNKLVIKNFRWLRQHPGADLERKGYGEQDWHFSKEFYTKVVEDLSIINDNFLKVLKVSRHLDRYAGRVNMQDGIAHIRKLKEYLEYFSFKDIISRTTKPPKKKIICNQQR